MSSITIIGAGRVGGALAVAFARSGVKTDRMVYRGERNLAHIGEAFSTPPKMTLFDEFGACESDILLIAVGDAEIAATSGTLAERGICPAIALHTSGSLSSEELAALRDAGSAVGSMHPLVSISEPVLGSERFAGSYFCIEGDAAARSAAEELCGALGAIPFSIDTADKPLYHASAVMAAGHVTALIDAAIEMLSECGLTNSESKKILLPLIGSTVANLASQGPAEALTGPFARGDAATFERHMAAFDGRVSDEIRDIYLDLAGRSVSMMLQRSPESEGHVNLGRRISMAKEKRGC